MNDIYKILFKEAQRFLCDKAGKDFVFEQCTDTPLPDTINDIYRCLVTSLVNTNKMKQAIGDINDLSDVLFEFDPAKTLAHYEKLQNALCWIMGRQAIDIHRTTDSKDYWKMFYFGVLSGASFLCKVGCLDTFRAFVQRFQCNESVIAVLPLLLEYEIYGLTYRMACTFLNSVGYGDFIAPDAKVKALLYDIEIIESKDNYETLKTIIQISKANNKPPYIVSAMFQMIGTESFTQEKTNGKLRQQFIEHTSYVLNRLSRK